MIQPVWKTKTKRRNLRTLVRGTLGTSSDPAPGVLSTLKAARILSDLLHLASSGRFRLAIIDRHQGGEVSYPEAWRIASGEEER